MKKAPDAFRTISEVAEILDTPAHVLRFWESKFYQIRPVKRAGGRRYYRPDDVALINGIKTLLQDQGLTIRGVQRVLQEQGVKHVAGLGGALAALEDEAVDETLEAAPDPVETRRPVQPIEDAEPAEEPIPAPALRPAPVAAEPAEPSVSLVTPDEDEPPLPFGAPVAEEPPAGTVTLEDEDATEALDLAAAETPDITPDHSAPAPSAPEPIAAAPAEPLPEVKPVFEISERAILARSLREMPRGALGARRDRAELLARRIDILLERMSEASGAGRW